MGRGGYVHGSVLLGELEVLNDFLQFVEFLIDSSRG